MTNDAWTTTTLGEVATLRYGSGLPGRDRKEGAIPVFGSAGPVGWHDVASVESPGVVVGRKGTVGSVHMSRTPFCPIDTTYFITQDDTDLDIEFLYFLLLQLDLSRLTSDVGVPGLNRETAYRERVSYPTDLDEQRRIAQLLRTIEEACERDGHLVEMATEFRDSLAACLFSEGVEKEGTRQTVLGQLPVSWSVEPISENCRVLNGSMSYGKLTELKPDDDAEKIPCMGVKVSDMTLPGNEMRFESANLVRQLPLSTAEKKLIPRGAVVFPKRGAAIATNKKRLATTWTVLDPNLIAVFPDSKVIDSEYLLHWFNTFDLKSITAPGPTPQLNKKDVVPILLPVPPKLDEQRRIAGAMNSATEKIQLHKRRGAVLSELKSRLLEALLERELRIAPDLVSRLTEYALVEGRNG